MGQGPQSVKKRRLKMELDRTHEGAYKPHQGFWPESPNESLGFCLFVFLFKYLLIFGRSGSSSLPVGFLQFRRLGALL